MSAENLEIVRRWLLTHTSEHLDAEAVAEFCDPDVDYYPARKFPEARPCHGREEFGRFLIRFREPWYRFEWEVQEVFDIGDERALAHITLHAEGRESGMNLEGDLYHCYWLRHGRFIRVEDHLTLEGALHALGLKGETLEDAGVRAPANLDLVRSILTQWERGDFTSTEWAHPEIEYVFGDGPVTRTWKGIAAMGKGFRDFVETLEGYRLIPDEFRELDDERVLVFAHGAGRAKTSGLELDQMRARAAELFHIRDGKVIRIVNYFDPENALADLGLGPEAGPGPM